MYTKRFDATLMNRYLIVTILATGCASLHATDNENLLKHLPNESKVKHACLTTNNQIKSDESCVLLNLFLYCCKNNGKYLNLEVKHFCDNYDGLEVTNPLLIADTINDDKAVREEEQYLNQTASALSQRRAFHKTADTWAQRLSDLE